MKELEKKKENFLVKLLKLLSIIIKFSNTILFVLLVIIIFILIGITLFDRFVVDSFFTSQIVNAIISSQFPLETFTPAIWIANFNLDSLLICLLIGIIVILIKNSTIKVFLKKAERPSVKILASFLNLFINAVLMVVMVVFFFNVILVSYINNSFEKVNYNNNIKVKYEDKIVLIRNNLLLQNHKAERELKKIMDDVENNTIDIASLSDAEYINFAKKISDIVDVKGGIANEKEHYFRNNFDRAPKTLDEMIETIKNPSDDLFKWQLVNPDASMLHMYGPNGEYNLKFVSGNGIFEAVYDVNGTLLTKDNSPINMGTFNYADFTKHPEKHSMYDVLTYFVWNNTPNSPDIESLDEAKFEKNKKAVARYNKYAKELGKEIFYE